MRKIKTLGLIITTFLIGFSFVFVSNANSYTWIYEENLNNFYSFPEFEAPIEIYNSFTLSETTTINVLGLYFFINPSNDTYTEKIKMGVYTNFNSSPNALLSQSGNVPILKTGWLSVELQTEVELTGNVNYWIGAMLQSNACICATLYYTNVTSSILFTQVEFNKNWDILFNPANTTYTVENTRVGALRVGYDTIYTTEPNIFDSFLNLFANPEAYIAGFIVCAMIVILLYYILRRR